jgi:hypothetical protein
MAVWDCRLVQPEKGTSRNCRRMGAAAAGIFLYVATDQVRYVREREPIRPAEIAPRMFSEVMRDVDLFVGVCSVGRRGEYCRHSSSPECEPRMSRACGATS